MPDRAVHVEIRGVRELRTGMRRLAENIDEAADARFQTTADQVATLVRSRVPHLTGRLASSVVGEATGAGAQVAEGAGVPYAGWIEFGGTRGRPYVAEGRFLYPASRDAAPLFVRAGEDAARQSIARTSWPTPTPL